MRIADLYFSYALTLDPYVAALPATSLTPSRSIRMSDIYGLTNSVKGSVSRSVALPSLVPTVYDNRL